MKNNIKKIIISIFVISVTIFISFYLKSSIQIKKNSFNNNNNNNENIIDSLNLVKADVIKIVDGDTIWVKIGEDEQKVRLIGIDAPEYTKEIEPFGKEATEYTTQALLNKTIYLQSDITYKDKYDRLLRYVWLKNVDEINQENISKYLFNYLLVYEGLAESKYYKPNITLQKYLDNAQERAKQEKRGIWK